MTLSKHLQEVLDKQIPKRKWFTKDDVILIRRTDWVLSKLVESGVLEIYYHSGETKYYYSGKTTLK